MHGETAKNCISLFIVLPFSDFSSWVWAGLYCILLILLSLIMCFCFGAQVSAEVLRMCVRGRSHTNKGYLIPCDYLILQVLYLYTKPVEGTLGQII